ncbi:hypothetical protein ACTFIU_009935 [Dictyostelium citrinum]
MINKIIIIFLFSYFFFYIDFCYSQPIIITDVSNFDSYSQYPVNTTSNTCNFNFKFYFQTNVTYISISLAINQTYTNASNLQDGQNFLYSFTVINQGLGDHSLNATFFVTVTPTDKLIQSYILHYSCQTIDYKLIKYKIIPKNNFKLTNLGIYGYIQFEGLTNQINDIIYSCLPSCNILPIDKYSNLFLVSEKGFQNQNLTIHIFYLEEGITNNMTITFPFNSYYNVDKNNSNIVIYPSESTNIIEFGYGCSPLYSITINKTNGGDYEPFIQVSNGSYVYSIIIPIYQNEKTVTYLGQLYGSSTYLIYSQFDNNLVKIYETPILSITTLEQQYMIVDTVQVSYLFSNNETLFNSLMFTVNFSSTTQIDFFPTIYSFGLFSKNIQWPFGFESGNNFKYSQAVSFPTFKYSYVSSILFNIVNIYSFSVDFQNVLSVGSYSTLLNFQSIHLFSDSYLFRIKVKTNGYGAFIGLGDVNTIALRYESMIDSESNINDTQLVFETVVDTFDNVFNDIIVFDILGIPNRFKVGEYFSSNPLSIIDNFYNNNYNQFFIKNITFLSNNNNEDIDVTNKSVENIIYFTYDSDDGSFIDEERPIGFMLMDPVTLAKYSKNNNNNNYKQHLDSIKTLRYSTWNSTISMYQIIFTIPANTQAGHIPYRLHIGSNLPPLDSDFLPISAQLFIKSSNFDGYGPIFSNIEKFNSTTTEFGWKFTINDPINGFDYGDIIVRGEMDSSIYRFHLTTQNLTRGDRFNGDYQININISSVCASQNYIITEVKLYDTQGIGCYFSVSESFGRGGVNNPFINYLSDSSINKLYKTCSGVNDGIDSSPPTLSWFNVTKKVEANEGDQRLTFDFQAIDNESGLKDKQYPIVYIETVEFQQLECESSILSKTEKTANYTCSINLPVGFAYNSDILFSVYGFINNGGYYSGFSSDSLMNLNFIYSMTNIELIRKIEILRVGQITSLGGKLWVIGKGFNLNTQTVFVKYYGDSSFTSRAKIQSTVYSNAMIINDIKPTDKQFIIKVVDNQTNQKSNELTVYPIVSRFYTIPTTDSSSSSPTVTNKPQTCLGDPVCGGTNQGYCSSTGCICYQPWIGNDCNSQIVIIPQPSTNTSQPSTELPIIDSSNNSASKYLFKSLISIVSLRELDFNSNEINLYRFDKWIYTPINHVKSQYFTSIQSDPKSINPLTTNFTVTLEWFNQTTIIQFANNNITMNPSSVKYTIEITEYKFINQLNSLQLIMSALFETSNEDTCSLKEFGDTSNGDNSNFFKIQIDNHSLYGRFIKRAIIDSKVSSIENQLLDSEMKSIQTSSTSQSFIGITIPNYKQSIVIDPDFSVLIDSKSISNEGNSVCASSYKSKLSSAQLAGIIIGSVGFLVVVIISIVYAIMKKKKDQMLENNIQNKLKYIN